MLVYKIYTTMWREKMKMYREREKEKQTTSGKGEKYTIKVEDTM